MHGVWRLFTQLPGQGCFRGCRGGVRKRIDKRMADGTQAWTG